MNRWFIACVIIGLFFPTVFSSFAQTQEKTPAKETQAAGEAPPLMLPLVYRSSQQRVLLAFQDEEAEVAMASMRDLKLKFDHVVRFDPKRADYSEYHLIIGGSNCMDVFQDHAEPEAFNALERFVAAGGHLMLFGTFNGRNTGHLARFGIRCGVVHAPGYQKVPGRTEVFFKGMEAIIPDDRKMVSCGNFVVDVPHVVLLNRSLTDNLGQPCVATLSYKAGRMTYSQVEPGVQPSLWIINVVANWAAHGAPTVAEQLDQNVVLDERELAERRKLPVPTGEEMQAFTEALSAKLRNDIATATTNEDKLQLADKLVQISHTEGSAGMSYAAQSLARDYYKEVGNLARFFQSVTDLKTKYRGSDLDRVAIDAVKEFATTIRDPIGSAELAKVCLDLADDLAENGMVDAAPEIMTIARESAQLAKHKHYQSLVLAATRRLSTLAEEELRIKPFREALARDGANPEANLEVGKVECLVARHWNEGLRMLARGSNESLRQLAEAEIKGTEDPTAQGALGDLWFAQGTKLPASMRAIARSRAKSWYWLACEQLSGQPRLAMERKVSKIATAKFELRISVKNSGVAQLIVTRSGLNWKQIDGTPPAGVQLNTQFWSLDSGLVLRNFGSTRFLADGINLETATLTKEKSQGPIELKSISPDELTIEMSDQKEAEFVVKFGP